MLKKILSLVKKKVKDLPAFPIAEKKAVKLAKKPRAKPVAPALPKVKKTTVKKAK